MTPGALVAKRMLTALGLVTREQVQWALTVWCKPSPRLSVLDVQQIIAEYPAAVGDGRNTETFSLDEMPPRGTVGTNLDDRPDGAP